MLLPEVESLGRGRSVTSVAAEFEIAHSIVSGLWRQFQTTGTAIRGFSSGRSRGTTPADDRYIVLQARRNRRQTAREIARRYTTQATERPISRFTVARRLHGGGLFARRPVRCTFNACPSEKAFSVGAGNTGIGTMNGDEYSLQMRADSV
ncbi:transposable element Tc1 transposase [Trichonephila clavipes]|nr:transposable element Tc1 transposase [Trichonephila clavipes]